MISDALKAAIRHGDTSGDACARRLRLIRSALGLTQTEMGAILGIRQNAYAMKERGDSLPRPQQIQSLLDDRRVDFNFIYGGDVSLLPTLLVDQMESVAERWSRENTAPVDKDAAST